MTTIIETPDNKDLDTDDAATEQDSLDSTPAQAASGSEPATAPTTGVPTGRSANMGHG